MSATQRRTYRRVLSTVVSGGFLGLITAITLIGSLMMSGRDLRAASVMWTFTTLCAWLCWITAFRPRVVLHEDALHIIGPLTTRAVEYNRIRKVQVGNGVGFDLGNGRIITSTAFGAAPIYAFIRDRPSERLAGVVRERLLKRTGKRPADRDVPKRRLDLVPTGIGAVLLLTLVITAVWAQGH